MGCFSYLCKKSGKPITSTSFSGDACRMYLLKDGKVIEEMRGTYDSYGRVFKTPNHDGETAGDSHEWKMDWGDAVDLHFNPDNNSGFAVVLEEYFDGTIPTTISEDDPNQGWDERSSDAVIETSEHIVY